MTDRTAETSLDRVVAEEWAAALSTSSGPTAPDEEPTADADFFLAGGNSLQAARLLAGLEARLGARIALRSFMADPRLGTLREECERALRPAPAGDDSDHAHGA
ncbi:acyl carrier protein [Nonomuraea sp. NPDC050783]|uniref:acyl carrier protein n=1 Tax=Nonomuraea sp. NPDC050783 TaxID=3154634 RepID=UPI003465F417